MKAKYLRIGNLISKKDVVVTVDGRSIFDIWSLDYGDIYKPIPLTEEWLLKFGFKQNKEYKYWEFGKFIIDQNFTLCDIDIKVTIKYVHQLQNLFFALTEKELEIK